MRLSVGLLLPLFAGATSAVLDAKVYMFQGDEWPNASDPSALSPEETRLVFAQRLGVSQFHSLDDASENTLSYINRFGRRQKQLFEAGGDDKPAELILFVEGTSAENAGQFLNAFSSMQPAFTISNPPSSSENLELVFNMDRQLGPDIPECTLEDDVNPSNQRCWKGKSKIIQIDLAAERPGISKAKLAQDALVDLTKSRQMNVVVVMMPESSWGTKSKNAYGSYEKLSQKQLHRREQAEEPITETQVSSSQTSQKTEPTTPSPPKYIRGVAPLCYTSLESCISSTNNCSGHGDCYKKSNGTELIASCFSCQCKPQTVSRTWGDKTFTWITYWGGGACQKEDVSGPFWLIAIFTVVMIGVIGSSIGMMYSIGEEKLPGVIGAGVSSSKTR